MRTSFHKRAFLFNSIFAPLSFVFSKSRIVCYGMLRSCAYFIDTEVVMNHVWHAFIILVNIFNSYEIIYNNAYVLLYLSETTRQHQRDNIGERKNNDYLKAKNIRTHTIELILQDTLPDESRKNARRLTKLCFLNTIVIILKTVLLYSRYI